MVFILLLIGFLSLSSVSADDLAGCDCDLNVISDNSDEYSIDSIDSVGSVDSIKSNLASVDSNEYLDESNEANLDESGNGMNDEDSNSVETDVSNFASDEKSAELVNRINNAQDNEIIYIEPGTYKIHNITLARNITLQGMGYNQVVIDGEYLSSIFLIHDKDVYVNFYNLTIIHGLTENFGGGICIETGNAYVDNCIFINNTALNDTNGGAISNYGNEDYRSYLFVNNSLFMGNHADHDGGAITTCYAKSDVYNSVFVNNSAHRDGGAIRVSVFGVGFFQGCDFRYNHADEWAGAIYSWSGTSTVDRCIIMNNTAGTNGGALMVSGNVTVTNNAIINNSADETGGSFYIQQPMYDAATVMVVNNNIITNNTAPLGQEVFIKWNDTHNLFPNFNKNYWGDENPYDSDIIDPNNVTNKSRPDNKLADSSLFETLNWGLWERYSEMIDAYLGINSENDDVKKDNDTNVKLNDSDSDSGKLNFNTNESGSSKLRFNNSSDGSNDGSNKDSNGGLLNGPLSGKFNSSGSSNKENSNSTYVSPSSHNNKMVELIEGEPISLKSFDMKYLVVLTIVLLTFFAGLLKRRERN